MKRILTLILAVMMCFALVSCGETKAEDFGDEAVSTVDASEETPAEKELYAMDFIGMKFSEVEKIYGTEYDANTYQGAYYILYKDNKIPYAFMVLFIPQETPIQEKEVVSVDIGSGGKINKDYYIGMSKAEMEKIWGSTIEIRDIEGFGDNQGSIQLGDCTVDIWFDDNMNLAGATVRKPLD